MIVIHLIYNFCLIDVYNYHNDIISVCNSKVINTLDYLLFIVYMYVHCNSVFSAQGSY